MNGDEYSVVQAAVVWAPSTSWFPNDSYLSTYGWGPYLAYSVNRNTLPAKRADSRQSSIGLYGTLFRIAAEKQPGEVLAKTALAMTMRLDASHRRNRVDDTESSVYTVDSNVVSHWLFDGIPHTKQFAWFVSPRLGMQWDDRKRVKAGSPLGQTRSVFGQVKADLYPGIPWDRVKLSLLAQRYVDLSASSGRTKRFETFSKAGIEVLLSPPHLTNAPVQPSIALERSYGADLLNDIPKQGLTQLVLKLKVN